MQPECHVIEKRVRIKDLYLNRDSTPEPSPQLSRRALHQGDDRAGNHQDQAATEKLIVELVGDKVGHEVNYVMRFDIWANMAANLDPIPTPKPVQGSGPLAAE